MLLLAVVAGAAGFALAGLLSVVAPSVMARRDIGALTIAALVFGAFAMLSAAAPTRITNVDFLLRVGVVAACVYLGGYAPPWAVLVSAALAAAASDHSSLQALALASLGGMVALVLIGRRAPVAQAVMAGAAALVALHLQWPSANLASSAAGVVVVLPVLAFGFLGLPAAARRPVGRVALGLAGVSVVFAGLGLIGALMARPHLQRGVDAARQALAAVRAGDRDQAADRFREARVEFDEAKLTVGSAWASPALAVPVVSPQVRALRVVADRGSDLSRVGGDTAKAADVSSVRVVDGAVPVDTLTGLQAPLQRAVVVLDGADTAFTGLRSPWLVAPIRDRLAELLPKIRQARDDARVAADAAIVLPRFLGAGGTRHYFLAMQNPSESRAVGGIIGNYGEIEATGGKLSLTRIGRVGDLNTKGVPPQQRKLVADPDFTTRYASQTPAQFWENVTMSPDFPSVAGVIRTLYPQSGGRDIDGVISINPAGLAALLRVVGPVNVPGWPTPVTADNVEEILEYDQYVAFPDKSRRLDFLATATDTIWKRLTAMQLPSAKELASRLGPAIRHKDIIFASFHADEQRLFDLTRASARMDPVRGDYLGVVTQNALGSKLDWFMRRRIDYRVTVDPDTGALKATLQIVLRNKAPASGLPPYVVNGDNPLTAPAGDNRTYLSVYTPWSFTKATVNGQPLALQNQTELGRTVLSHYLDVMPGSELTVTIELAGRLADPGHYRLDVYHQPTIAADQVTTSLSAGHGGQVAAAKGWSRTSASSVTLGFDSTADSTLAATLTASG